MPQPETYKCELGSKPTMCQVRAGAYVSLLAPGTPTIPLAPLAPQERLPRIYCTQYLLLRIRPTDASQWEKTNKGNKQRKEDNVKEVTTCQIV